MIFSQKLLMRLKCINPVVKRLDRLVHKDAVQSKCKWHLMSAVTIERPPIVTAEMNELEKKFSEMLRAVEKESSLLSDHELRKIEEKTLVEKRNDENYVETESEVVLQTAIELEDIWEEELKAFKPASRITDDDRVNNLKSTDRKLDRKLYLFVNQNLGQSKHWVMPMGLRIEGESMRQAAERILEQHCGSEFKTHFLGNAPCGFYKYKYPPNTFKDIVGAKIFFFKAHYRSGLIKPSKDVADYKWLTKEEMDTFAVKSYARTVQDFMMEF